jgi:hypothetical protein
MGTIIGTIASVVVGGIVASATIFGVVSAQTSASGDSPSNVDSPVIAYGSK